jgi:hypothetical protein
MMMRHVTPHIHAPEMLIHPPVIITHLRSGLVKQGERGCRHAETGRRDAGQEGLNGAEHQQTTAQSTRNSIWTCTCGYGAA